MRLRDRLQDVRAAHIIRALAELASLLLVLGCAVLLAFIVTGG